MYEEKTKMYPRVVHTNKNLSRGWIFLLKWLDYIFPYIRRMWCMRLSIVYVTSDKICGTVNMNLTQLTFICIQEQEILYLKKKKKYGMKCWKSRNITLVNFEIIGESLYRCMIWWLINNMMPTLLEKTNFWNLINYFPPH